tara:strand:+ start:1594 stop:2031 length:438 start_codon:yes stop_codon:yes gene_type:complete
MKNLLIGLLLAAAASAPHAGHHEEEEALILEKRQADALMTITNVNLGDKVSTISATGKMGVYGSVYVTYNLSYTSPTSGFVTGQGRGAVDADTVVAGALRGVWTREGSTIKIRQVVQISDGSQNLDVIDIDMLKDNFIIKAYALK